jgi:DNA-binding transcriptional ArsR family regulator
MNVYMPLRTPKLLAGLGSDDALDVALALLERPRTIGELTKATGLSQVTVTRKVAALRASSLVEHSKRKGIIVLRNPNAVRELLLAASEMAGALAGSDAKDECDFRSRLHEDGHDDGG